MTSEYEKFINEWTEQMGSHPINYNEDSEHFKNNKRTDYCYSCKNDQLYPHAMTLKCNICHKIILG